MPHGFEAAHLTDSQHDQVVHGKAQASKAEVACGAVMSAQEATVMPWPRHQSSAPASHDASSGSKDGQHAGICISVHSTCTCNQNDQQQLLPGCSTAMDIIWRDGTHTAPPELITPDIEDAYQSALAGPQPRHYKDPASGYTAFTEVGLRSKSVCCGNKCRHCPFGHFKCKQWGRVNRITSPTLLTCQSRSSIGKQAVLLVVTAWQHEQVVSKLYELQEVAKGATVAVLVAVNPFSRHMWQTAECIVDNDVCVGRALDQLMDCCLQHDVPLLAVPVMTSSNAGNSSAPSPAHVACQVVHEAQVVLGQSTQVVGVAYVGQDACVPCTPWLQGYQQASASSTAAAWDVVLHSLGLPCMQ